MKANDITDEIEWSTLWDVQAAMPDYPKKVVLAVARSTREIMSWGYDRLSRFPYKPPAVTRSTREIMSWGHGDHIACGVMVSARLGAQSNIF